MVRNFGVPRQIDRHERNAGLADMACDFCDQAWHYQPGEVPLPRLMLCTLRGRAHETTDMIRGGARNRARALKSMTLSSIVPPHLRLYRLACTANCEPPAFGRQFLQSEVRMVGPVRGHIAPPHVNGSPFADVRSWHETDVPPQSQHVSYQGMNGPNSDLPRGPSLTHLRHAHL